MSKDCVNMNTGYKSLKNEIKQYLKLLRQTANFVWHAHSYIRQLLHRGQRFTLSTAPNNHPQWFEWGKFEFPRNIFPTPRWPCLLEFVIENELKWIMGWYFFYHRNSKYHDLIWLTYRFSSNSFRQFVHSFHADQDAIFLLAQWHVSFFLDNLSHHKIQFCICLNYFAVHLIHY